MKRVTFCIIVIIITLLLNPSIASTEPSQQTNPYHKVLEIGRERVNSVDWHPTQDLIATGGNRGMWIYDNNLNDVGLFPTEDVEDVAWHPTENLLAVSHWGQLIEIWDTKSGTVKTSFGTWGSDYYPIAWSPDGTRLAVAGGQFIRIWDLASQQIVADIETAQLNRLVSFIVWSPDGTRLASGGDGDEVHIWDMATYIQIATLPHPRNVETGVWSPSGDKLATVSDTRIQIWNTANWQPIKTLSSDERPTIAMQWVGIGLLAGDGNILHLWDVDTGQVIQSFSGHTAPVTDIDFNAAETSFVTFSIYDGTVRIWSVMTGQATAVIYKHDRFSSNPAWNPNGTQLATAYSDDNVLIWNTTTGLPEKTLTTNGYISILDWSADGLHLAGAMEGDVMVWNVNTADTSILTGHMRHVEAMSWHPFISRLATASTDTTVKVWDTDTGQSLLTYAEHTDILYAVDWNPNGEMIASADASGIIKIWNATNGQTVNTLSFDDTPIEALVWSPSGHLLGAVHWNNRIIIWDPVAGSMVRMLEGDWGSIGKLDWQSDTLLTTGGSSGKVNVWDINTAAILSTIVDYKQALRAVVWSPDRRTLAISTSEGSLDLWQEILPTTTMIGNRMWLDSNANGLQDASEFGLFNVRVNLLNNNFGHVATTSTDSDGFYKFLNLVPGTHYYIQIIPPADTYTIAPVDRGTDDTRDSDFEWRDNFGTPDPTDRVLRSMRFTASAGMQRDDLDAGFMPNSDLRVRVWRDTDGDGVQDTGEQGMAGVSLFLRRANFTRYRDPLTTDSDGFATFTNLPAGDYYVQITVPSGYSLAPFNIGPDDNIDNDFAMAFDYETGSGNVPRTLRFTLAPGLIREDIDAGLKQP